MSLKTYAEWRAIGRSVRRGERAVTRAIDGVALFSHTQTELIRVAPADPLYDMMEQITDYSKDLTPQHRPQMGWSTCPCLSCERMRMQKKYKVPDLISDTNPTYPDPSAKKDAERDEKIKAIPAPRVPFDAFKGYTVKRGHWEDDPATEDHPLQKTTPMPSAWGK
jgi:hypothetical protein